MKRFPFFALIFLTGSAFAATDPFALIKDRFDWATEQLADHQGGNVKFNFALPPGINEKAYFQKAGPSSKKKLPATTTEAPVVPVNHVLNATTAWGNIKATVTDRKVSFDVLVETDPKAYGWELKIPGGGAGMSGSLNGQNTFTIHSTKPYSSAFTLIVYVTDNNNPAEVKFSGNTE